MAGYIILAFVIGWGAATATTYYFCRRERKMGDDHYNRLWQIHKQMFGDTIDALRETGEQKIRLVQAVGETMFGRPAESDEEEEASEDEIKYDPLGTDIKPISSHGDE